MSNLIHAGFVRLFGSLSFKVYIAFAAGYSVLNVLLRYYELKRYLEMGGSSDGNYMDIIAFDSAMTVMMAAAFFMAIFIGREYTDGAIRNKLIVGRGRGSIYLSNFVVCVCANLMAAITALLTCAALGIPLLGTDMSVLEYLGRALCELTGLAAITAVYLIIVMMISSRAVEMLVTVLSAFAMLMYSSYVQSRLEEPEFYGGHEAVFIDETGDVSFEYVEEGENPLYLKGDARKVFEFIDSFLPSSQLLNNGNNGKVELPQTVIYDIIVVLAAVEGGVLLFSKKDIK